MRRPTILFAVALAAVPLATLSTAAPARAAVPVLVIDGRGFGHGVGLAQDGALTMARQGASTAAILGHFYPGTTLARRAGFVRVPVLTTPGPTTLTFPDGGDVLDAATGAQSPGFPLTLTRGGQVRVWFDGRYHVEAVRGGPAPAAPSAVPDQPAPVTPTATAESAPDTATTSTTAPPAPPALSSALSSDRALLAVPGPGATVTVDGRGRRYRGVVEVGTAEGKLRLVNQVDVETYLLGMGEVRDPRWPAAALRSQAVVARTYALRAMAASGGVCDDQHCQVYLGAQAEYPAMTQAVRQTRGQVVTYRGQLAATVYSANGGGMSATPAEGFGTSGVAYPYLRAAPYPTGDPAAWTVRVSFADVAARLGYPGSLSGARVTGTGPSGRAVDVSLDGAAGVRHVTGIAFDRALGLRSTLFTLRTEQAAAPPPSPPPTTPGLQSLPDQEAAPVAPPLAAVAAPSPAAAPGPPVTAGARTPSTDALRRTSASRRAGTGPSGMPWGPLVLYLGAAAIACVGIGRLRPD